MKIRRILITAILAALLLLLSACSLLFDNKNIKQTPEGLEYRELTDFIYNYTEIMITGIGSYEGTVLVIPDEIEGHTVTRIDKYAFEDQTQITSVTLPKDLSDIGKGAFKGCTSLSDVVLPKRAGTGSGVFENCTSLETLVVERGSVSPKMLEGSCIKTIIYRSENIGGTLKGVTTVEKVIVEYGAKKIGERAFAECTSLKSVSLPGSLKTIGNNAFEGCTSLTEVTIPDRLDSLGEEAFKNCSSLEKLTVGKSVKTINKKAFINCNSLKVIYFNAESCEVMSNAFSGCFGLETVFFTDNCKSIPCKTGTCTDIVSLY